MSGPTLYLNGRVAVHAGDCADAVRSLADNSIDAVCTDPPYALVSIVKRFGKTALGDETGTSDRSREGADGYARLAKGFMGKAWDNGSTAFSVDFWAEVWRVLKPGAHVVAFCGTRSYHRLAVAIEDAGFEIRDQLAWTYGTGFNKKGYIFQDELGDPIGPWGGSLKPAWEPICLARKPLSEKNVIANISHWGTAALNIDGCRVGERERPRTTDPKTTSSVYGAINSPGGKLLPDARWPANIVHDGSDEVISAFPDSDGQQVDVRGTEPSVPLGGDVFGNGMARIPASKRGDSGSAARFFYSAKADSDDRLGSKHPTVKPVDLMQWLCRLITPPARLVCPQCGRVGNGKDRFSAPPAVRAVREDLQAKESDGAQSEQVLQQTMRGLSDDAEAQRMRDLQETISTDRVSANVLREAVRWPMGGEAQEKPQAIPDDEARLSPALQARSSAVKGPRGIHFRTPMGGGTEDRSSVGTGRSCSPSEWDQGGQRGREPSIDEEGRPRQAQSAASEQTDVSSLSGLDRDKPTCPHCGTRLELIRSTILDPFAGTGTTAEAAYREGFNAVLCEREAEYLADIARRMKLCLAGPDERARESIKARNAGKPDDYGPLFDPIASAAE